MLAHRRGDDGIGLPALHELDGAQDRPVRGLGPRGRGLAGASLGRGQRRDLDHRCLSVGRESPGRALEHAAVSDQDEPCQPRQARARAHGNLRADSPRVAHGHRDEGTLRHS